MEGGIVRTCDPLEVGAKVVELSTGRSIVVRINDRGPFIEGRIID
ncbi:septal ring lytic transglycosylase RlpA family protein, partial [Candidatus Bipolaricaulota bacterium]|nr:septal ring lytic transglycosylase RlpA family protein [Candidatus Bipolaricaulota bacterium]